LKPEAEVKFLVKFFGILISTHHDVGFELSWLCPKFPVMLCYNDERNGTTHWTQW